MLHLLVEKIAAVCPIIGVNSLRVVSFKPEAAVEQRAVAQAIADAWDFDEEETKARNEIVAKRTLVEIDNMSVRTIREWIAARPDAPQRLKDVEIIAQIERAKLTASVDESP